MKSATREQIDLMLPTKKREDLEAYRDSIIRRGIQAGVIPVELYFGHNYFTVEDPDGHVIFIYTSHEQDLR